MSFQLHRRMDAQGNLRAIAQVALDRAIKDCRDEALDIETAVHDVRKRCKKMRGLYRLFEPAFPDFKKEDAVVRNIARKLAGARDADVALNTFDMIAERFQPILKAGAVEPIRSWLEQNVGQQAAPVQRDLLLETAEALEDVSDRARKFKLEKSGFSAIRAGMATTLKRAGNARRRATKSPKIEALHDWRKHVKYHWHHLRLFEPVWPDMLAPSLAASNDLQEMLGDEHDMSLLRNTLTDSRINADPAAVHVIVSLIDWRRAALMRKITRLGDRLFAEDPTRFLDRMDAYTRLWRDKAGNPKRERSLQKASIQMTSGG